MHDIRWKQRFENFQKAYLFLKKSVQQNSYDELQAAGLIQSFEFTFELAWKTLKDYQTEMGTSLSYPREVIKEAFKGGLIDDGYLWIAMLDDRNELTHCYSDEQSKKAIQLIREKYFPAFEQVYQKTQEIVGVMIPGLTSSEKEIIINVLKRFPHINQAILFGSRAKGTYHPGSDVDIALRGMEIESITSKVSGELNDETPFPYFFDVVAVDALENNTLREHIERVGIVFYNKE